MRMYFLRGLLLVLAVCFCTCSEDAGQSQGAFCDTTDDCMVGLVCRQNICTKPEEGVCDPACNPDGETCFEDQCVVVVDPNDKDGDGSLAAADCNDFDHGIHPEAFEHCDGVDNNCDGQTDEDCPVCQDGASRECGDEVGECTTGTMTCTGGQWQGCSGSGPAPELCDGLDNDCDGLVDEVCPCYDGEELACSTDAGECSSGFQKCENGAWGECINGVLPQPELCDGVDDDCDGLVDDGFDVGGDCIQPGECGPGFFECAGEDQVRCSTGPGGSQDVSGPELCNQLDDDCDGETDEDFAEVGTACDGDDSDKCANGIWACTADLSDMECGDEVVTDIPESCNQVDDDCDGVTDEDFNVGEECIGLGGCGDGVGRIECAGDFNVRCSTNPGGSDFVPRPEACDEIDNDCDGETDEDFPEKGEPCDGLDDDECKNSVYTCALNGSGTECINENPSNIVERCNYFDDDCNGVIDDTWIIELDTECNADADACMGKYQCNSDGSGIECYEPPNQQETFDLCNGLDDDCNGVVDDIDQDGDGVNPCDAIPAKDCCDEPGNPNASSVNPSSGFHAYSYTCGGQTRWDWNCDGAVTKRWNTMEIPCITGGWDFALAAGYTSPPNCGVERAWIHGYVPVLCIPTGSSARVQECK